MAFSRSTASGPSVCHSPRHDALIEPVATCVGPGQPARFAPCTTTANMDEMFRRSYGFAVTA